MEPAEPTGPVYFFVRGQKIEFKQPRQPFKLRGAWPGGQKTMSRRVDESLEQLQERCEAEHMELDVRFLHTAG